MIFLEIYDLHTHILPCIDDGAENLSETLTLVKTLKNQGVCGAAATPHFFARMRGVDEAVDRRNEVFKRANEVFVANDFRVVPSFEVRCFAGMSRLDGIQKLCYGNSNYILLELPYNGSITPKMLEEIVSLNLSKGLKPIMAHIERYTTLDGFDDLISLINDGYAEAHINTPSLNSLLLKGKTLKLIKSGAAGLIASDTHNLKKRPPEWDKALSVARKKLSDSTVKKILCRSAEIWNEVYYA